VHYTLRSLSCGDSAVFLMKILCICRLGLIVVVLVRQWTLPDDGCEDTPPLDPLMTEIRTLLASRLRTYVAGSACVLALSTATVALLVAHSARGAPIEVEARKYVPSILKFK
jgi:hypothetical protein